MIVFLFSFQLWATPVAIQGAEISNFEFEKKVVENPGYQTFIDHTFSQQKGRQKDLLPSLKKAQFHFLKGSLQEAQSHYQDIAEKKFEKHWDKKSREIIHYAHIRLAQLSHSEDKKKNWLLEAFLFQPNLRPDSQLFPPPLVAEYNKISSQHPVKIYPMPEGHDMFSQIYINGELKKDRSGFFRSRGGKVRMSFLSNRWHPIHWVSEVEPIKDRKLILQALAKGSCQSPDFQNIASINHLVLFDKDCLGESPFLPAASDLAKKTLNPPPPSGESRAFYKSKWFWIGVSILATVIALYSYDQQQKKRGATPHSPESQSGGGSPPTFSPSSPPNNEPIEITNN